MVISTKTPENKGGEAYRLCPGHHCSPSGTPVAGRTFEYRRIQLLAIRRQRVPANLCKEVVDQRNMLCVHRDTPIEIPERLVETIVHYLDVDFGIVVMVRLCRTGMHHNFRVPQEARASWVGARKHRCCQAENPLCIDRLLDLRETRR